MAHARTIKVGKFRREIPVEVFLAKRDTRWDVYPSDIGDRFLVADLLGDYYRWSGEKWFKSDGIKVSDPVPDAVLDAFGVPEDLGNLQEAVSP